MNKELMGSFNELPTANFSGHDATLFADLCAAADMSVDDAIDYLDLSEAEREDLISFGKVSARARQVLVTEAKLKAYAPQPPKHSFSSMAVVQPKSVSCNRPGRARQKRPTAISLFAGAGGLDLGLEDAGFETLFANEIEPHACETLRQNQLIRSLSPNEFEDWFKTTTLTQRCHQNATPQFIAKLHDRIVAGIRRHEDYLSAAIIDHRDVRLLEGAKILEAANVAVGEIDLIAGGPPCQPFSRAGKREMIDCDKGQLFSEFVRIVEELKPRWFLFENVKGLVIQKADVAKLVCGSCRASRLAPFQSRDVLRNQEVVVSPCARCDRDETHHVEWKSIKGGSLNIIENEFSRIGYKCYSTVLNGANFGTPQSRERLFIVGSRDGEPFSWPTPTHFDASSKPANQSELFTSIRARQPWITARAALYDGGHWQYGELDPEKAVLWVKNVVRPHDEPVTWTLDRVAPTVGAHQAAKLAIAPLGVPPEQLARQQWHVLGRRQGDTPPVFVEHEYLSDDELLKLQTFPSSWYLHGTRMERAFQIGNAVPPLLAKAVGEAIMAAMGMNVRAESISEQASVQYA